MPPKGRELPPDPVELSLEGDAVQGIATGIRELPELALQLVEAVPALGELFLQRSAQRLQRGELCDQVVGFLRHGAQPVQPIEIVKGGGLIAGVKLAGPVRRDRPGFAEGIGVDRGMGLLQTRRGRCHGLVHLLQFGRDA